MPDHLFFPTQSGLEKEVPLDRSTQSLSFNSPAS